MMKTAFSGITPTVVLDTTRLQHESEVVKQTRLSGPITKSSPRSNVYGWDVETQGVCMSMVCDWFQKCAKLGHVSQVSELKSSLGYSLAQTAYGRYQFDAPHERGRDKSFIKAHDLKIKKSEFDFYNPRDRKGAQQALHIATKLSRTWSNYIILLGGLSGGHALGYNASLNQFLDPNIGILGFASQDDFAKWLAEFLPANYPGLMNSGFELIKLKN